MSFNMRLIFDTEGDGLREECTQLWCIVTKDIDTNEVRQFYGDTLEDGIHYLATADYLSGHNCIGYDIPVLKRLYNFEYSGELFDTLVVSRLLNPDRPLPRGWKGKKRPHSVEAWGMRFGRAKPEHEDWSKFSMDMLHRCTEDVEIQFLIYQELLKEMQK